MTYTALDDRYLHMNYSRCGDSGLRLPQVSLGIWHNFGTNDDYDNMRAMCCTAFDHGITHFDAANNYGPLPGSAEEHLGKLLKNEFAAHRDELIISTKAGYLMWDGPYGNGGSRKYLLSSLDQSLRRLGLEYVDIFYHHRPDTDTPLEESMLALDQAVKSGKALYAGISNYDKARTRQAVAMLRELKCPFVLNQSSYSIFDRHIETDGLKHYAAQNGIGIIAFSPLAQGMLSDRYLHGVPADSRAASKTGFLQEESLTKLRLRQISALNELAQNRRQTLAQMALSWVLRDGEVTSVLIGASRPAQILDNIQSIDHTAFSPEELAEIDRIYKEGL